VQRRKLGRQPRQRRRRCARPCRGAESR
jgi:hypothetical protein